MSTPWSTSPVPGAGAASGAASSPPVIEVSEGHGPGVPEPVLGDHHPTPTHCGITIHSLYSGLTFTLLPLVVSAAVFMGWRGLATLGAVLASSVLGILVWRLVGQRGRSMNFAHGIYLAVLLAMLMPADLARPVQAGDAVVSVGAGLRSGEAGVLQGLIWPAFAGGGNTEGAAGGWPLLVAAGFTLATFYWLFGGVGARLHAVAATVVVLLSLFPAAMTPQLALTRPHLIVGDLCRARPAPSQAGVDPALFTINPSGLPPAIQTTPASDRLSNFSHGVPPADTSWLSIDGMLRDRLPPLEDLILGGHPGPLGLSSMAAVLLGGLLLLYRSGADWRVPLLTLFSAFLAFLCLRVPLVTSDAGPVFKYFAFVAPGQGGAGLATMATYALYQISAGPLVFTSLFLATSAASCPTSRRGRTVYALLLGVLSATLQTYWTVAIGPLGALLLLCLAAPVIDRLTRPKPLL